MGKCLKVSVDCIISNKGGEVLAHGVNTDPTGDCEKKGCLKIRKYGNNSSEHRNPADCNAVHAEVIALMKFAKIADKNSLVEIWVSRYPCEACIRTIIAFSQIYGVRFYKLSYNKEDGEMSNQSKEMWDNYLKEAY